MPRSFWEEMKPKWPAGFWDDWLREPQQRRNRAWYLLVILVFLIVW
jgi:alpha-1,3-mannosyl-glycoprotein beta-1,2-N-acetylglucosaminyltransferase